MAKILLLAAIVIVGGVVLWKLLEMREKELEHELETDRMWEKQQIEEMRDFDEIDRELEREKRR